MNIIINNHKLLQGVRIVEKIISRNPTLPILNTILLKTENNRLKLSATNLEIGINYWIGAKINKEGEVAIPARVFSDFISNINSTDDNKITLIVDKNVVTIDSDAYKSQILGMETKDFPIVPRIKKDQVFSIQSQLLKTALISVFESASLSETRPELNGIFMNISPSSMELAATDSFRLAEKTTNLKNAMTKSVILPRNTAAEIIRIMEGIEEDVMISVSENQIVIYGEDFEIISRLIDGHYPDYRKVIPEKFISLTKINKKDFEKSIRMASIFSSTISDIKIKAKEKSLEIAAKNNEKGEILANMACETKNKPFEISVNYHYLLDGLKVIPAEYILIEFTGDGSPVVLKGEDIKDQTYVIMPLRG